MEYHCRIHKNKAIQNILNWNKIILNKLKCIKIYLVILRKIKWNKLLIKREKKYGNILNKL